MTDSRPVTRRSYQGTDFYVCDHKDCEEAGTNGSLVDGYWCDIHWYSDGSPYAGFL